MESFFTLLLLVIFVCVLPLWLMIAIFTEFPRIFGIKGFEESIRDGVRSALEDVQAPNKK